MEIHEILPVEEVRSKFEHSIKVKVRGMADLKNLKVHEGGAVINLGCASWHRVVHNSDHKVSPTQLKEHFSPPKTSMIDAISKVIGEPCIRDIGFVECTLEDKGVPQRVVARVMAGHIYPDSFHVADVFLCNPYRPEEPYGPQYSTRHYHGLGLVGTVLSRAEEFAREKGIPFVTLTAAADDLVPLFRRHGYELDDNHIGRLARQMWKRP